MKEEELRYLFELCREHNVASFEKDRNRIKVVFYEAGRDLPDEDPATPELDADDEVSDSFHRSPNRDSSQPQLEGPYPASIFSDGEAPSFNDG